MIIRVAAIAIATLGWVAPTAAETWREVTASDVYAPRQTPVTVSDDGVTVTVTPGPPDDDSDATIVVEFPGFAPYRVPTDEYRTSIYGISVGIGRMARDDATPTVLLGGYSGGAHCCATLQIVSLVDGRAITETLPMTDSDRMKRFPRDIDGDGAVDIRWSDDSLQYQFASHAGSWNVPRIYNMAGGKALDVSRQPGFAGIFQDFAQKTLESCRKNDTPENGDCAAYAYAMAVLGQAEEGIGTAASLARPPGFLGLPEDCSVEYDENYQCPEGKEITFHSFEPALRWLMRKHGYLP
jgi:hypothetical protein